MAFLQSGGSVVGSAQITDGAIVNADINANAAIALSKIANPPYAVLADVTLGTLGVTLDTGTFTAKTNLRIIVASAGHAVAATLALTLNNDTGANYAYSISENGAASATSGAASSIALRNSALIEAGLVVLDLINITTIKKRLTGSGVNDIYAHTIGGSWNNTASQVTRVTVTASNNFAVGSRIIVLGMN